MSIKKSRQKYGVIIIGVFGSYVTGEQKETSDIDILVELERPIGLKFFEFWDYLEEILGCSVDLVRAKLLREEIKEDIKRKYSIMKRKASLYIGI